MSNKHFFTAKRAWICTGLALLMLIVAVILGFILKKQETNRQTLEASHAYEKIQAQLKQADYVPEIVEQAKILVQRYPNTSYASFALLHLARQAVYKGNLTEAIDWLTRCIEHSQNTDLKLIALHRIVRVLHADHQVEQARQWLGHPVCQTSPVVCQQIKGDLLTALGELQEAQTAYQLAAQMSSHLPLAFDKMNTVTDY